MTAADWQRACAVTLDYEGGNDNDPHDPGGRTSRGITQREWTAYRAAHANKGLPADVWRAPQADIVTIYRAGYWDRCDGDAWPVGADLCVYDASVNSGLGKGLTWARAALALRQGTFRQLALIASSQDPVTLIRRYQARRLSFLHALRTWAYFGRGWARRVAGIEAIATRWALAARGAPTKPELQRHAAEAKQTRNGAAGAAGGAAAPIATHITLSAPHTWADWAIIAGGVLATAAIVAYLVHLWYVHTMRAQAFTREAAK